MTSKTDIQKTPAKQSQKAAGNSVFRHPGSTGKELDLETGFSYFGARYLDNALSTAWLSVDPMSDKYPNISPYSYCAWSPLKRIDPNGRESNPIYTTDGEYLGNTKEGFTGEPLIIQKRLYEALLNAIQAKSSTDISVKDIKEFGGFTLDDIDEKGLSGHAQKKIVSHIISQYKDKELSEKYDFNASDLASRIYFDFSGKIVGSTNFATYSSKNGEWPTRFYFRHKNRQYEFTVENITASLVYHEWLGHMQMDWGDGDQNAGASNHGTHYACYLAVIISPIFGKTTSAYQNFNTYMFNTLFK